jgi:two-component system osmolarity sensor histidine kinase EnvZ
MTSGNRTPRPWTGFFRAVSRLGLRTLVLTIFAIALINITISIAMRWSAPDLDSSLAGPPLVRQAAAAARLMDELGAETRPMALAALNSPVLQFSLSERFDDTPPVENPAPVFVPLISMYQAVLGDRPFSVYQRGSVRTGLLRSATLSDDIIIVMRLADGTGLIVTSGEEYRRLVGSYGVTLLVGVLSVVLIGLMTWASLSYARPLEHLASASRTFVESANNAARVEPLPETGPRPVRELASALNLAGTRIARAMTEQTTTLAAIAHDLRTYLTRLRMRSEFIEDEIQREKIAKDIEDMSRLIDDTLLLGEAANKELEFTRVDLTGWLAEFVARRAEVGDAVHAEKSLTAITADIAAPELTRVLNNLVDNALRYAGSASIAVSWVDPETVAIDVVDDGPGVPADFIAEMSRPFTRIEGSRSRDTGGAGLGLAIAKALLQQIGGGLGFSNLDRGGFLARVTLSVNPMKQPPRDA